MASVNLPLEIVGNVCKYVDGKTLKNVRLASKAFAHAAASELFRTVYLGLFLESLAKLENIAAAPHLRRLVHKLILCGEALSVLAEERFHAAQGGDPPDYRRVLPAGVPVDQPATEPWTPLGPDRLDKSVPSDEQRRPCPIRMIGPSKGRPAVLLENGFGDHCAFYDFDGARISKADWFGLAVDYILPRQQQEERLYLHHQYFYEQANWLLIGSTQTCAALARLPNLKHVVISPTSVRYFQSEPFWYNMFSKLCEMPSPFSAGQYDLIMIAPILLPLLSSLAKHNSITSLELLLPVHLKLSEMDLASLFGNLSALSLGVGYNASQAVHGVTFSQYQLFMRDLIALLKQCARLRSLNLWFPKRAEDLREKDTLEDLADVHFPCLAALTLTGFPTTLETVSKIVQTHARTLRALDLKSLQLNQPDRWRPLIERLPTLVPDLDWFWASGLTTRHWMKHEPHQEGLPEFYGQLRYELDLPLHASIQYFNHRMASARASQGEEEESSAPPIFDTTKWYELYKDAMVDLAQEFLPVLNASGSVPSRSYFNPVEVAVPPTDITHPDEADLRRAQAQYQQDLRHTASVFHHQLWYRRNYDAVRRRLYGYDFE